MLTGKCAVDHPLKSLPCVFQNTSPFPGTLWLMYDLGNGIHKYMPRLIFSTICYSETDHPVSCISIIKLRADIQMLMLCWLTELIAYINIPTLLDSWLTIYEWENMCKWVGLTWRCDWHRLAPKLTILGQSSLSFSNRLTQGNNIMYQTRELSIVPR